MARKYKSKHTGQRIDNAVDNTDNNVIVLVGDTMQDGQGIARSLVSQKKIVRIIGEGGIRTFSNNNSSGQESVIIIDGSLIKAGTSPEQIAQVVREWLADHPEATTTVADESITMAKLAKAIKEKIILNLRGDDYSNGIPSITFDDSKNIIDILGAGGITVYTSTQAGSKSIVIDASNVAGGYQKPSTGIPESDLSQAVKNKLNNPAFPEAPTDGKIYGRKSGAWTEISEQTYTALAKKYAEDAEGSSVAAQEAADNAEAHELQARQSMENAQRAKNAIDATLEMVASQGESAAIAALGKELEERTEKMPSLGNTGNVDLEIADEDGNVLACFVDGHIKTKNFDSSHNTEGNDILKNLKVLACGDSITAGQGLTDPTATRWVSRLANNYNWDINVVAYGGLPLASNASGRDSIITRLTNAIQTFMPDLIIVWGGHNDVSFKASPYGDINLSNTTTWCGCIKKMVELRDAYAPNARIVMLTLLHCNNIRQDDTMALDSSRSVYDMDEAIRKGSKLYGFDVIEMGLCGISSSNSNTTTFDGIHPNLNGTEKIFKYLSRKLEQVYISL